MITLEAHPSSTINGTSSYQVAEVVRNLALREADKGLSAGEKSMFVKARQVLVSELALALDISEDSALERLEKTLT